MANSNQNNGDVRKILSSLPDDKSKAFTEKIQAYISGFEGSRKNFQREAFLEILQDKNADALFRFKAFYVLFTYHHSKHDTTKCKHLVDETPDLAIFPLWHYAYSTCLASELSNSETDMHLAINEAEICIRKYEELPGYDRNYPGIYHNYSEIVYNALDREYQVDDVIFQSALQYIDRAMAINPMYAKYYYTKGRLLLAKKHYGEAKDLLQRAIDLEDSKKKDYSIRIAQYSDVLTRCKSEERLYRLERQLSNKLEEMNKQSAKINEELADQKKQTLELLGFFSGIISLIIVTTQALISINLKDAALILITFLGVLLVAFSYLGFMTLSRKDKIAVRVIFFILGVGILGFGIGCSCGWF